MAQQSINIGSNANDGTGDPLRTAFNKINANFNELYGASAEANDILEDTSPQLGGDLDLNGNKITTARSNENIVLDPAGTGTIELNANTNVTGTITATGDIFANGNINLGNASGDQTKVIGVFEADQIQIDGTTITTNTTNGSVTITGNASGGVNIDNLTFNDNSITSASNADINLTPGGTGNIVAGALTINGTAISAADSTLIQLNEAVNVSGALAANTSLSIAGDGATVTGIKDEDNMASDSAVKLATQQSIKAYADTKAVLTGSTNNTITTVTGANAFQGEANLTFDGSTLAVTGAATVSTTLGVTGTLTTADITTTGTQTINGILDVDGIRLKDHTISGTRSNDNLNITASGTGTVNISSAMTTIGQTITGDVAITGKADIDNVQINGNKITTTNSNGTLTLEPNGTGSITLNAGTIQVPGILAMTTGLVQNDFFIGTGAKISANVTNEDVVIESNGTGSVVVDQVSITDNKITTHVSNADLQIDTDGTGFIDILTDTQSTVGSAGGASALPGQPTGYIKIKIGGTLRVIPFYDQA
ncbi:MAG: hypothetical protein CBB97_25295 [Candidatus Endolissoclinum sp. TMED37]|nr:MAG: hypothetical protein CBB97_25295 [Candidatus Endolissoclinum sp. TMED37]|tara:strand:- start:4065 stop:5684 length:1620 start_codon:yes stop_codon:yes gene_type:complete